MPFVAGQVPTAAELNAITTGILKDGLTGTTYVPTLTQGATPTKSVEFAVYARVGPFVLASVSLNVTSTATAANAVVVGLPPVTFNNFRTLGVGSIFDASASTWYHGHAVWASATTCQIWPNAATSPLGVTSFTAALASGDKVCLDLVAWAT